MQLGDFPIGATVDFKWSTNAADGSSITRGTDGEVRVYIGNGATQTTAGVTDTEDFDGLTGIHHCRIVLSDAAYVAGSECQVVLAGAVVDGKTINAVLAHFSIKRDTAAIALLTNGTFGLAVLQAYLAGISPQVDTIAAAVGDDLVTPIAAIPARFDTLDTSIADVPTNAELATALAGADDAVLAQVALVKAKTDALPADPADASDIAAAFSSVNSTLATIAGYLDTEIAAIKAKTDLLPADPASQAIIIAATDALAVLSAAIKAKTDSLAFTSGRVHADTKAVAGVVLQQNGSGTQSIGGP